jgi:hypothetical protein
MSYRRVGDQFEVIVTSDGGDATPVTFQTEDEAAFACKVEAVNRDFVAGEDIDLNALENILEESARNGWIVGSFNMRRIGGLVQRLREQLPSDDSTEG